MELHNDVHYEIQRENSHGEWAEFLHERPNTEKEIPVIYDRARARYPGERIRAVRVTTTVTVEKVFEESDAGNAAHELERELHHQGRVLELLQDCD